MKSAPTPTRAPRLEPHLEEGEQLLWAGAPVSPIAPGGGEITERLAVLVIVLGLAMPGLALLLGWSEYTAGFITVACFGGLCAASILFGIFYVRPRWRRRTAYGITTRRVLMLKAGFRGERLLTRALDSIEVLCHEPGPSGSRTVWLSDPLREVEEEQPRRRPLDVHAPFEPGRRPVALCNVGAWEPAYELLLERTQAVTDQGALDPCLLDGRARRTRQQRGLIIGLFALFIPLSAVFLHASLEQRQALAAFEAEDWRTCVARYKPLTRDESGAWKGRVSARGTRCLRMHWTARLAVCLLELDRHAEACEAARHAVALLQGRAGCDLDGVSPKQLMRRACESPGSPPR